MSDNKPIFVTKPFLPPLEEFMPYLTEIWKSKVLTNGGPFHQALEAALCSYLGVQHISLFSNGTIALITALQALGLSGEVITTPYSFIATANSLLWNGLTPVFVDVDPDTLNMDPAKIEAAITPRTTALLPVHCYGHPCDVEAIRLIAERNNLKVVYDAAHAFGVRDEQGSILRFGDLAVLSFHATKVFNTFEGGAIVCPDADTKRRIDQLKNFGFADEITVDAAGMNGKMSEVNAAFGLLQLKHIESALDGRAAVDRLYREQFAQIRGIRVLADAGEAIANFSYFPILVGPEYPLSRDGLQQKLKDAGILARRYFYPLITDFAIYREHRGADAASLPVAQAAANQVLCLPIYPDLTSEEIRRIVDVVKGS